MEVLIFIMDGPFANTQILQLEVWILNSLFRSNFFINLQLNRKCNFTFKWLKDKKLFGRIIHTSKSVMLVASISSLWLDTPKIQLQETHYVITTAHNFQRLIKTMINVILIVLGYLEVLSGSIVGLGLILWESIMLQLLDETLFGMLSRLFLLDLIE